MGRYGGNKSGLNKRKQVLARRLGLPIHRVNSQKAATSLGVRYDAGHAKPGFEVKIVPQRPMYIDKATGRPVYGKAMHGNATDLEQALRMMRRYNPKLDTIEHRRRPRK